MYFPNRDDKKYKLLIAGAGVAGLTVANFLLRDGHTVRIVEKSPKLRADGTGITLGYNALQILDKLGLTAVLSEKGIFIHALNVVDQNNMLLGSTQLCNGTDTEQISTLAICRSSLHEILSEKIDPEMLWLNTSISEISPQDDGVIAKLDNGTEDHYDLILACDGITSQVRQLTTKASNVVRYSGYTCWRFVLQAPDEMTHEPVLTEMWGSGKRVGFVPMDNCRYYGYLTINAREKDTALTDLSAQSVAALFAEFRGPVQHLLAALSSADILLQNDIYDLNRDFLISKATVFLGDAAHAATPNMGQGAAMAIEDAYALSNYLYYEESINAALAKYCEMRKWRVSYIRNQSYWLGKLAQTASPSIVAVRNALMKITPDSLARRSFAKLVRKTV